MRLHARHTRPPPRRPEEDLPCTKRALAALVNFSHHAPSATSLVAPRLLARLAALLARPEVEESATALLHNVRRAPELPPPEASRRCSAPRAHRSRSQ